MAVDVTPGSTLAGFRVERLLGRGGMGAVYLAEDERLRRRVAIKVLAGALAEDQTFRRRFLRESQLAASLDHPHVVPIYAAGEQDGLLFLAMKYIAGTDLRGLIRAAGGIGDERAVGLLSRIADALDTAHGLGLVHRDVKPANILIGAKEAEDAYLCDFGLAKHALSAASLTEGAFVGTVAYSAPEQIEGGAVDARTDVYSLGCVLFECLTGAAPFIRAGDLQVMFAHLNTPPPSVMSGRPELPEAVDGVVRKALAKAPDDRFATCGDLVAELCDALDVTRSAISRPRIGPHAPDPASAPTIARDDARQTNEPRSGRGHLPVAANRTIGRHGDVDAIAELLCSAESRLVTLIGPGGVGKTRVAIETARAVQGEFGDGARFVSLATVHQPDRVVGAIVDGLGLLVLSGERSGEALRRFLGSKELLLLVDNFEHVLDAASFISELLDACGGLTVLATSREPLNLQSEQRYAIEPLAEADGVALFCARARSRDLDFRRDRVNDATIAEICRRLDGLPLAIELAAARCDVLSPSEIISRLRAAADVLGAGPRDAPARQQTLRATIDWSHNLLERAEQQCFARFAVFAGGATADAAETTTGAGLDTLGGLVAKSLLGGPPAQGPARLSMLETIRVYALERFSAQPDSEDIRERHFRYFLELAERHGSERALWGRDRAVHLAVLDADADNIEAALRWSGAVPRPELTLAMVVAAGQYWLARNRYDNGIHWIDKTLAMASLGGDVALRARVMLIKDRFMRPLGRGAERRAIADDAVRLASTVGDPTLVARALGTRAHLETNANRRDSASAIAEQAIVWAMRANDDWELAQAHYEHALAAPTMRELEQRVEPAASRLRESGNLLHLATLLAGSAYSAVCYGADQDAATLLRQARAIASDLDDPFVLMMVHGNVGLAALFGDNIETAREAFDQELKLGREFGVIALAQEALRGLAGVAVARHDLPRAGRLVAAAARHRCGEPEDPVDARLESTFFKVARVHSDPAAWAAAMADGAAMSLDDAIAYALGEPASAKLRPASK